MESRVNKALEYRKIGYTCTQAILCTYADLLNIDFNSAFRISEGFGLGFGTMNVCGALSGILMVGSLVNSDGCVEAPKSKANTYKINKEIVNDFNLKNKTLLCSDLKGITNKELFKDCNTLVSEACIYIENNLLKDYFQ